MTISAILALGLTSPIVAATIVPSSPTSGEFITARIEYVNGCLTATPSTQVFGSTIRTNVVFSGCIVGPPPGPAVVIAPIGQLPAGTYAYDVYFEYELAPPALESQQVIIVAPAAAAVPTVANHTLIALAGTLALLAVLSLRGLRGGRIGRLQTTGNADHLNMRLMDDVCTGL